MRQLNSYGFTRLSNSQNFDEFTHKLFVQGHPEAIKSITRSDRLSTPNRSTGPSNHLLRDFRRLKSKIVEARRKINFFKSANQVVSNANKKLLVQIDKSQKIDELKSENFILPLMAAVEQPSFDTEHVRQLLVRKNFLSESEFFPESKFNSKARDTFEELSYHLSNSSWTHNSFGTSFVVECLKGIDHGASAERTAVSNQGASHSVQKRMNINYLAELHHWVVEQEKLFNLERRKVIGGEEASKSSSNDNLDYLETLSVILSERHKADR